MTGVFALVITGVLALAALLTTIAVIRGPSVLDRAVGADVLVSILCVALGVEAALSGHATTLPILVTLSLVGFVGSVAVARFAAGDRDPGRPREAALSRARGDARGRDGAPGAPGAPGTPGTSESVAGDGPTPPDRADSPGVSDPSVRAGTPDAQAAADDRPTSPGRRSERDR